MAVKITNLLPGKYVRFNSRPLDYIYDYNYVVSDKRDFQRCFAMSAATEAEYQICPIFQTMFSDAYPRNEIVLKRTDRVPPWIDKSWEARQRAYKKRGRKSLDIGGADRHRFFRRPIVPFLQPAGVAVQYSITDIEQIQEQYAEVTYGMRNHGTQTDYRDSETQTSPWAPPVLCHSANPPEILTLASLSWDHGLPAGMHEVEIIERARKKRAWEKLMPTSGDPKCIELMRYVIETMERDEWLFRETEIETINNMHLELAQKLLKKIQQEQTDQLNDRVRRYWLSKQEERTNKIQKIRNNCSRELRKLALRHKNIRMKYHEGDIVEEHRDYKSELYGPQMRFGEHPKRSHEVINVRSRFLSNIKGLEILETMPRLVPPSDHLTRVPQKKSYELCIRETRWTEAVLTQLHQDLKDIRTRKFEETGPLRLIQRLPKPSVPLETQGTEGVTEFEEVVYQSAVFLQKIIKGRAIQTLMCKGRRKYQELIEEMKSTTALQPADVIHIAQQREQAGSLHPEQMVQLRQEARIKEIMSMLEGKTISSMLDFLSKELWKLQDERRIHAFAMLAERQRYKREAAEAGRRQIEERRRREHDEIFKQLIKVHQDTVDIYLEDLVMESLDWTAEAEARHHVRDLAQKIDKAAEEAELRQNYLEQEELVADLIHNFVVPEVQKQIIRKQIKQRQTKYLQEAHACIYNEVENLPPTEHEEKFTEGDSQSSESGEHILDLEEFTERDVTGITESVDIKKAESGGFDISAVTKKFEHGALFYTKRPSAIREEEQSSVKKTGIQSYESIASQKSERFSEASLAKSEDEKDITTQMESSFLDEFTEDLKELEDQTPEIISREHITDERQDEEEEQEVAKHQAITKPKITLTDKEFKKEQEKHKLEFFSASEKVPSNETELKSKPRIGFKESDEEINEESIKYQKPKHKIGFKIPEE